MTAQFPDSFIYNDKEYDLVAYSAEEPFNPTQLGFNPVGACSACWRGYIAKYSLEADENLILKDLSLSLFEVTGMEMKAIRGKSINGVLPAQDDHLSFLNNHYENINLSLRYTGGMLIVDDFIQDLYVHMGFHPAWKYREVHELIFEEGRLRSANDRSAEMAEIRKDLAERSLRPDMDAGWKEIFAWIERTFDQKYS